jgi:hypothetical protein
MSFELFPKVPQHLSLKEKVEIHSLRFEHGFFLNKDIDEIDIDVPYVKPNITVTSVRLKDFIDKDRRAKIKKLSWAFRSQEEYCQDFKRKVEEDGFSSLAKAEEEAARLYREYSCDYNKQKATVSSLNGRKIYNKRQHFEEDDGSVSAYQTKQRLLDSMKHNYSSLRKVMSMDRNSLKEALNVDSESTKFLRSIPDYVEPTKHSERVFDYLFTLLHASINDL